MPLILFYQFNKSLSLCSLSHAVARHSSSQTKSSVRATRLTPSAGGPPCRASCKILSPPIGTLSWWDTRLPLPILVLTVCPWCPSCHQKPSAPLSWEARKAPSGLHLRCPYTKLRLRLVCVLQDMSIRYILCCLMWEPDWSANYECFIGQL